MVGGGEADSERGCGRGPCRPGRSRVLFQSIFGIKKIRRSSPGTKSKASEQVHTRSEFSNGNVSFRPEGRPPGGMACILRPRGRLFPYFYKPRIPPIPQVLHWRKAPSVPRTSFRAKTCATGLHQGNSGSPCLPKKKRSTRSRIFRRLAAQSKLKSRAVQTDNSYNPDRNILRLHNKLGKVSPLTNSKNCFLRSRVESGKRPSLPVSGEGPGYSSDCKRLIGKRSSICTRGTQSFGQDGILHRCDSSSQIEHETASAPLGRKLGCQFPATVENHSGPDLSESPPSLVDKTAQSQKGSSDQTAYGRSFSSDGRFPGGLGGTSGRGLHFRSLVGERNPKTYQLVGNGGSLPGSSTLSPGIVGQMCDAPNGQHNCSFLHKQTGRNPFTSSLSPSKGPPTLVQCQRDNSEGPAYSGSEKRNPGCSVEEEQNFPNRVDSQLSDTDSHISDLGQTTDRPVCDGSKQATPNIRVTGTRLSGMGGGCPVPQLGEHVRLCLSPGSPGAEGHQEDPGGGLSHNSNSPVVAETTLVPGDIRVASGHPSSSTNEGRSPVSTSQRQASRQSGNVEIGCLEAVKTAWLERGISEQVASRAAGSKRKSTYATYDSRLHLYYKWCRQKSVDPLQASVDEIGRFLEFLFQEGRQVRTISGYRAAISVVHHGWNGVPVGRHPLLSQMMKAFFLKRPPQRTLVPSWNLPLVLMKLCLPPFEPMHSADMKFVAWKTLFLVAAASARRRSTLHALSIEEGHIQWSREGVNLIPHPGYLAKNESFSYLSKSIFLPDMHSVSSVSEDKWLCPCRALKLYIRRTKVDRGEEKQLFLCFAKGRSRPCSQDTLSRWAKETIQYAYQNASLQEKLQCRAHDVRGMSSSWALSKGVPLEDIMAAANWKGDTTFTAFYMRDVEGQKARFSRAVLSSVRS